MTCRHNRSDHALRLSSLFAAAAFAVGAVSASAQSADPATTNTDPRAGTVFDGDYLALGIGGAYLPSYEGSNNYLVTVAPLIRGSLGGFDFESRGTALAVDILPNPNHSRVNLLLGPEGRLNFDRTSRIRDAAVSALGKKKTAFELGGFAGVAVSRVLDPYDTFTLRADVCMT